MTQRTYEIHPFDFPPLPVEAWAWSRRSTRNRQHQRHRLEHLQRKELLEEIEVLKYTQSTDFDVCAVEAAIKIVYEAGDDEFDTQILFNLFHEGEQLLKLRLMCGMVAE